MDDVALPTIKHKMKFGWNEESLAKKAEKVPKVGLEQEKL
jgi:hypothetical protein